MMHLSFPVLGQLECVLSPVRHPNTVQRQTSLVIHPGEDLPAGKCHR